MKRYWLCVAAAGVALAVLASTALVQERAEGERRPGARADRARPMMGGRAGLVVMDYSAGIRDLSPEQRKQIGEIRRATVVKLEELQKQMNGDIKKLLTPAQAKAMEETERRITHRGPDGVTLTDAQKTILDEARANAAKAENREARAAILQAANEKIRATFTDEQKKQAAERPARVRPARPARQREQ